MKQKILNILALILVLGGCSLLVPQGLDTKGWHLLLIFIGTILSVMLGLMPLAVAGLSGLVIAICTNIISFESGFASFTDPLVWLVVSSFFVAHALVVSGLGSKISLRIIAFLGGSITSLTYGIFFTELVLASMIPSATARTGGILYPIISAINKSVKSNGQYFIYTLFAASCLSSTTFLTGMAGNALVLKFAQDFNVTINWYTWFIGAIVPSLITILIMPFWLMKNFKVNSNLTLDEKLFSAAKTAFTQKEIITATVIILMLAGWVFGSSLGIKPTIVALMGVLILLYSNVLSWNELTGLKSAWDTFIWFGALVSLALNLSSLGVTKWLGSVISYNLIGFNPVVAITLLALTYFYLHYFFASSTAHTSALMLPFAVAMLDFSQNTLVIFLALGYISNLCATLTHFGNGPAPILFGSGFFSMTRWWQVGFYLSLVFLGCWLGSALLWWHALGWITFG